MYTNDSFQSDLYEMYYQMLRYKQPLLLFLLVFVRWLSKVTCVKKTAIEYATEITGYIRSVEALTFKNPEQFAHSYWQFDHNKIICVQSKASHNE